MGPGSVGDPCCWKAFKYTGQLLAQMMFMISSKWNDVEANRFIELYSKEHGEDVALRTYSARLIGQEKTLVLHGGGNTSVKSSFHNILKKKVNALFVKGSGWDLATIEPAGHPGLDLEYLKQLRILEQMDDEVMVNELRTHLFNANSPTPSVETLLHAFLPAKFIDHSHADAILALTNTEEGEDLIKHCFGDEVVVVPYVMPGFGLAKLAADLYDKAPGKIGMVLLRHGLFTFGETARESYERHLELVNRAIRFADGMIAKRKMSRPCADTKVGLEASVVLPVLRGLLAINQQEPASAKKFILSLRQSPEILEFVNNPDLVSLCKTSPLTPDHVIRTKALPLVINIKPSCSEQEILDICTKSIRQFSQDYSAYFERCSQLQAVTKTKLDDRPRVILVPGLGQITVGETHQAAEICGDIYEQTISVKSRISKFSNYKGLSEVDLFDVEYWRLEQAKLKQNKPKLLSGRVAMITGGCGAIGIGIAKLLKEAGAEVVVCDISNLERVSNELKVMGIKMDVTCEDSVKAAFKSVVQRFGGIDIVVPNAGVALSAPLEKIDAESAKRVMDINFHGYLNTIKLAAHYLTLQNANGHIVIISSKNVMAPGKEFAIYSASKAAGHQLGRIAALELAPKGIKVNMLTPDAVFGSQDHPSGLWQEVGPGRAKARGLEVDQLEEFYRSRNLLRSRITAEDVGRAVLFFVSDQTPTTGASLPIDGGIPEAFPR